MSFEDLPPLPPLLRPEAAGYAARAMALTREAQKTHRVAIDLPYGGDYWQKADVYQPAGATPGGWPVVVFFHGGAWTNGTKEWMGFMAPTLLAIPVVYVAANYRLAPTCRHPGPLEDCCDVIAWVARNIAHYGGNPARIFMGGHSAGGHLAALAVLSRDLLARRNVAPASIAGCLPVSGSFDLRQRRAPADSMERRVYDVLLASEDDDAGASPIQLVEGNRVPFYIAYGERDFPRLVNQGAAMVDALRRNGSMVRSDIFPGLDHFEANLVGCIDETYPWLSTVRAWTGGRIV